MGIITRTQCVIYTTSTTSQKEVSELKKEPCSPEEQFFGAVTVGERGQVVIPAEARKRMDINPGDKLLVMGHPCGAGVMLAKIGPMREFLSKFMEGLTGAEKSIVDGAEPPETEKARAGT